MIFFVDSPYRLSGRHTLLFHNAIKQYYVISEQNVIMQFDERKSEERNHNNNSDRVIDAAMVDTPDHCSVFNYAKSVVSRALRTADTSVAFAIHNPAFK